MKTCLYYDSITLLTRRSVNILFVSALVTGFLISSPLHSFAMQKFVKKQAHSSSKQAIVKELFKDFCFIYYHDGQDPEEDQDTQVCQKESSAFASLLLDESPQGSQQWAVQSSLHDLAHQKLLSTKDNTPIRTQQYFANSITDSDLKALIGGGGNGQKRIPQDSAFLPTLWDFKLVANTPAPLNVNPSKIPSSPSIAVNINVTCRIMQAALSCSLY